MFRTWLNFAVRVLPCTLLSSVLAGCVANQLSEAEIARLQGGTTTVVVFGFCVPMNHIVKTTLFRTTMDFVVDGKVVGKMQTCSHKTFQVKSGYWSASFAPPGSFPSSIGTQIYRPGAIQYLYMAPDGHGYTPKWVSKAEADQGIAEINKIGQIL